MTLQIADRVWDTTVTTGTGTVTLAGSPPNAYQAFGSVCSDGDTIYYALAGRTANVWEVGLGTYHTAGPTLARTTIFASSSGSSAVTLSGTTDVMGVWPASKFIGNIANNTVLGNNSGGAASPTALTQAQITALLNVFTSSLQGVVPSSGGGTTNFLRADGTWNAPAGGSPGGANTDVQFNNSSAFGGDSGFTYAGSGQATLALGTITANAKALNITGTWNAAGVTFDAPLFMNIVNTASNAASLLTDFQVGGSSVLSLDVSGNLYVAGSPATTNYTKISHSSNLTQIGEYRSSTLEAYLSLASNGATISTSGGNAIQQLTGSNGLNFYGSGAVTGNLNELAQTNSTNAIIGFNYSTNPVGLRIYNTTDASTNESPTNYERVVFDWTGVANVFRISQEHGGTGSVRSILISTSTSTLIGTNNQGYFAFDAQGTGAFALAAGTGQFIAFSTNNTFAANASPGNLEASFYRDAAVGVLAIADHGSSTTATGFRVYNTTDNVATNTAPTNYERGAFDWTTTANVLTIGVQAGGTGTLRNINLKYGSQLIVRQDANSVNTMSLGPNSAAMFYGGWPIAWNAGDVVGGGAPDTGISRITAKVTGFGDGSGLNANGWMQWAGEARTTSATNYTNNTPTTILSVALQAGRTYSFDAYIPVTAGGSAGGLQVVLLASGGLTVTSMTADSVIHSNNVIVGQTQVTTMTTMSSAVLGAATGFAVVHGTITVNVAGTFNIQTAQSSTNATTMTVGRGARLIMNDMP